MTDEKADLLQRFLSWARILIPLIGILLVVLQWWQNAQLMDEARSANQTMRQIWTGHPPEFPLETLAAALYVPAAVSPLGAFDPGEGPWLAQSIWLQLTKIARGQDQLGYDAFPSGRQLGMSAATFAQLIIPSLALLLAWRQVRQSKSTSLQSWTSLQTSLIEYIAPMIAICCLLTAALQRQSLGAEGAIRLMLILGAYVMYSLASGTICWLIFQSSASISRATGILVLFWVFNLTLARPFTVNLASTVFPLPSLDSYARRIDFESANGYNGVEPKSDRYRRYYAEILRDYKASNSSEVPVNLSAIMLMKEEQHQREVGTRLRSEIDAIFVRQERLEQILSMAFPLVAIQISSSALSATDFASERRQLNEADAFWDQIVKKVYYDVAVSSGPAAIKVPRGSDYWSQFPFFESMIPSPFWALFACLTPACGLLLFSIGGIVTAFRAERPEPTEETAA